RGDAISVALLGTGQHSGRDGIVISCSDVKTTALRINGGRLPYGSSAVTAGLAAVLRNDIGLPPDLPRVGVESHHAPTKRAARITWLRSIELLTRGDADVNRITKYDRRARDHCCRMLLNLCDLSHSRGPAT